MSIERESPIVRAALLLNHAERFAWVVDEAREPESSSWINSQKEIEFGRLANLIARELEDLDSDLSDIDSLPALAADSVGALRRLFFDLMKQWGWENVVGPNGDVFLIERGCQLEARRRDYL